MKIFWIKLINVILIVFLLCEYNHVIKYREQQENIDRLDAELKKSRTLSDSHEENNQSGLLYANGIYEGEGKGFGGSIKVNVTIQEGMIADIDIVSAGGEDGAYLGAAKGVVEKIISEQSADVDSVSGATFSSGGIKAAVGQALKKAET